MKYARLLIVLSVFAMVGTENAKTIFVPTNSLCIVCTNYCKTHPNAPRCN